MKKEFKSMLSALMALIMLLTVISAPACKNSGPDISKAKIGDTLTFGVYEQDNNESNGKEKIEWFVLDKKDSAVLLISKYAIECRPFNTDYAAVAWDACTLRKWLNEDFINEAFNESERARIKTTPVVAAKNPSYDSNPGNDTEDHIFILSIDEAEKYFVSNEERMSEATERASADGLWIGAYSQQLANGGNTVMWWLRSPGGSDRYAAAVRNGGAVGRYGNAVNELFCGVRPVLWLAPRS